MTFSTTALLLTWVAIGVLALAVSGLLRQIHVLMALARPAATNPVGPAVGSSVPSLNLSTDQELRRFHVTLKRTSVVFIALSVTWLSLPP
jgi:hypothetical protein